MWAPGQPAPPFAQPPLDEGLKQRIDTLCSYAAKNGARLGLPGEGATACPPDARRCCLSRFIKDAEPVAQAWATCAAQLGSGQAAAAACHPPPLTATPPSALPLAGHSFVQMMGERQGANPEFAFLRGGDGAPYFAWALCCALTGLDPAAPPAAAPRQPPLPQQPQDTSGALGALPPEVASGWQQVLGLLNGSRDSIRNSQQWFMACAPHAAGMAEMMLQVRELRLGGGRRGAGAGSAVAVAACSSLRLSTRPRLRPCCPAAASAGAGRARAPAARDLPG